MKSKKSDLIFIVCFMAVCLVPLVLMPFFGNQKPVGNEPEPVRPQIKTDDGKFNKKVMSDAGEFFSKKFAFRQQLINTGDLIKGKVFEIAKAEFAAAKAAGLDAIRADLKAAQEKAGAPKEEVKAPPAEIVTAQIPGIEVMDLEDAVQALWKENIYAESGMGCTGPIVRISEANKEKAVEILKKAGYVS